MIQLPDDVAPADIVGETDLMAGEDWLNRRKIVTYANWMVRDEFPWETAQIVEPMSIAVGVNGKVINLGHHRWVAARLAGVVIPYEFELRYDYLQKNMVVPFAFRWEIVHWE